MKKLKKGAYKKVIVGLLFGLIVTYAFMAGLRTIIDEGLLQDNMLDYEGTWDFIKETTLQNQFVILVLGTLSTGFTLSKMGLYKDSYLDASEFGVHGTARWGTFDELLEANIISKKNKIKDNNPIKSLNNISNGLVVGREPDTDKLVIIPKDSKINNRNLFLIGSSGSGKGQGYVIFNIVNNTNETIIVTDPKGELYHATKQIKEDQGYDVFQVDFLNLTGSGYNPLDYIQKDIDSIKIANAISKNSAKDGKEDFFFSTARDLLTGLIIYCKDKNPNANIPIDVKREYHKILESDDYLKEVCANIGEEHTAYQYLKDASAQEGKVKSSIMSSFAQQTAILNTKDVQNLTKGSDFSFHDFQKRKSVLYVKIPMKNNPVEALTATFFDQLIGVFYDIADKNAGVLPISTIFMLDEFANLGKIEDYEGTLSTCRGLGISMNTVVQDLGQLEAKYGKETARTIVNNHDTILYLRTRDSETAKYFSSLAGETTVKMTTHSTSQSGGIFSTNSNSSRSDSEQYVKRPLITEGELLQIKPETCYVFIAGFNPLKLEKAFQYQILGDFLDNYNKYRTKLPYNKTKKTKVIKEEPFEETTSEKNITNFDESLNSPLIDEKELVEKTIESTDENVMNEPIEENEDFPTGMDSSDDFKSIANEFLNNNHKEYEEEKVEQVNSLDTLDSILDEFKESQEIVEKTNESYKKLQINEDILAKLNFNDIDTERIKSEIVEDMKVSKD